MQPPRSGGLKERIESAVCECKREVMREIGGQVIWTQRLAAFKPLHVFSERLLPAAPLRVLCSRGAKVRVRAVVVVAAAHLLSRNGAAGKRRRVRCLFRRVSAARATPRSKGLLRGQQYRAAPCYPPRGRGARPPHRWRTRGDHRQQQK